MALVTHTTLKAAVRGGLVPEDVMAKIWDISKIPLPMQDLIGDDSHKNEYAEWVRDELAAPNTANAMIDGADAPSDSNALPTRIGNHSQQAGKTVSASTRARDGATLNMGDAYAYQVMMRQQELKRDVDAILLFNQASLADSGVAAGTSAGLDAWLTTNDSSGSGGSATGFNTSTGIVAVAVPGTKRALSEATIRDTCQTIYDAGGNPSILMGRTPVIRRLSAWMFSTSAQVATLMSDVKEKRAAAIATGAVNVFVTDFGIVLTMLANRLQPIEATATSAVFIIDPEYLACSWLTRIHTFPLAKTGTADKGEMVGDFTLKVMNEKAHGVIRAVDEALAVTA